MSDTDYAGGRRDLRAWRPVRRRVRPGCRQAARGARRAAPDPEPHALRRHGAQLQDPRGRLRPAHQHRNRRALHVQGRVRRARSAHQPRSRRDTSREAVGQGIPQSCFQADAARVAVGVRRHQSSFSATAARGVGGYATPCKSAPSKSCRSTAGGPWAEEDAADTVADAIESGHILHLPRLAFPRLPHETRFLSERWSDGRSKNITLRSGERTLRGASGGEDDLAALRAMLERFAAHSQFSAPTTTSASATAESGASTAATTTYRRRLSASRAPRSRSAAPASSGSRGTSRCRARRSPAWATPRSGH